MPAREGIAIFGGTFDPVHVGHLRSALEARDALQTKSVRLIPSYRPPHREDPGSAPLHRLEMLKRAVGEIPFLEVDDREIRREGKSFMIDTLASLREEVGNQVALTMVLGFDAFLLLSKWKQWERLNDYAHLAVLARPGSEEVDPGDELTRFFETRRVDNPLCLRSKPHGMMCRLHLTQMDISASQVREMYRSGRSTDYLVPKEVDEYIRQHGLYGAA